MDIALVYGIPHIVPPMHIKGAAYASLIAQLIMTAISIYFLLKKTPFSLKLNFPFNPELKRFGIMIANLFVRTLALNVTLYLGTSYATDLGKNYIAAYTIAINLWFLGAFIIDGYASAGNIMSGKLLGAKNYNLLVYLSKKLTRYALFTGFVLMLIGFIFYHSIGTLFTKETLVLTQFYSVFWLILLMQPLCAVTFIFDGIYKGLGKMHVLRNVLLIATFLVFIPALYLLDKYNLNLHTFFIALALWVIARGIPLIILFKKTYTPHTQKM